MKKTLFPLFVLTMFLSMGSLHAQNADSEKTVIEMLMKFYTEHNAIWTMKPPVTPKELDNKLDFLTKQYCTSILRIRA